MPMDNNVLKIGVIGLGNQGKKHLDALRNLERTNVAKLVAVCDTIKGLSRIPAVKFYRNYKSLYANIRPDVVIIAVPNYLHKRMVLDALNLGIHVIKEKPIAMNYNEAKEIVLVSQMRKRTVMTMQQRYKMPIYLRAKREISLLGGAEKFSYRFTLNDTIQSWYWDINKSGGGSWLNMGWHAISVINWIVGEIETIQLDLRSRHKRAWKYDTDHSSLAKVLVKKNILGSVFLSCAYPKKEESMKVVCRNGTVYISRGKLRVVKKGGKSLTTVYNDSEEEIYKKQLKHLILTLKRDRYNIQRDVKIMAVIQAGIDSAGYKSKPVMIRNYNSL
jgi:predicted dehydrogenase